VESDEVTAGPVHDACGHVVSKTTFGPSLLCVTYRDINWILIFEGR
jgi:hypothetical protein